MFKNKFFSFIGLFIFLMIIIPIFYLGLIGFDKIPLIWEHTYLLKSLQQTLFVCIMVVVISHLIGVPLAIYLSSSNNKFHQFLIYAMLISTLVSGIVKTISWISLLSKNGLINNSLVTVGIIDKPLDLLYNNVSIIVGFVYVMLPLVTINVYTATNNIDPDLIKCARSLGATSSRVVKKVIIPQVKYEILTTVTIVFITCLTLFSIPKVLGGKDKLLSVLLESSVSSVNYADAISISILMVLLSSLVILVVTIINRQSRWM